VPVMTAAGLSRSRMPLLGHNAHRYKHTQEQLPSQMQSVFPCVRDEASGVSSRTHMSQIDDHASCGTAARLGAQAANLLMCCVTCAGSGYRHF
jgi:hypothetical protein